MIMELHEGMRVQRVDFEHDGTPAYEGVLTRIERDDDELTYWVTWDGADAPDPHGRYAFVPLPDVPEGWTVVESAPLSDRHVAQLLRRETSWAVRTMRPWGEYGMGFCASESDARALHLSAIENYL